MDCVEWEENARATGKAAPVRSRRARRVALVGLALVGTVAAAALSVL